MNEPIQDTNVINLIIGLLFCLSILSWTVWRDWKTKKNSEEKTLYDKSLSWRVYIVGGTGFLLLLYEMLKRIF